MSKDIVIEPYTVDHYRLLTGKEPDGSACLNQIAGPAYAVLAGGQVLAIGGIRTQGIGQAWALLGPAAMGRTLTIIKAARAVLERCIVSERLYRVYAEATVDKPAWFDHLGFHQQNNLFVR